MNTVIEGGKHNLRREWQRRHHGPRRNRAVVGSIGHATAHIIEELALEALGTHEGILDTAKVDPDMGGLR
jgi:hypothetical protein